MTNTDLYEGFAGRYDLAPGRLDDNDPLMVKFFRELFSEHGVQAVLSMNAVLREGGILVLTTIPTDKQMTRYPTTKT